VKILYIGFATIIQLSVLICASLRPNYAQTALTTDQFRDALTVCAAQQNIAVRSDTIKSIGDIYADQAARGALRDPAVLVALVPNQDRVAVYALYAQCISKVLPQSQGLQPQPPPTVSYRVCTGEYERQCQSQHDAYLYCYSDVEGWAKSRCSSYTIQRLNTYGGNKCGYSIDAVICTGPR